MQRTNQLKAVDRLYKEYSLDRFEGIIVDETTDPELALFVKSVKDRGPRFNNYDKDTLETFAKRIYELRKNQSNNSAG